MKMRPFAVAALVLSACRLVSAEAPPFRVLVVASADPDHAPMIDAWSGSADATTSTRNEGASADTSRHADKTRAATASGRIFMQQVSSRPSPPPGSAPHPARRRAELQYAGARPRRKPSRQLA